MSDLISRDEAIKAIKKRMPIKPLPPTEIYTYFGCIDEIKALPSAEPVEVVRCKDCKHYKKINPKVKSGMCYKDIVASAWNDDGFCSRGERKGGDDE